MYVMFKDKDCKPSLIVPQTKGLFARTMDMKIAIPLYVQVLILVICLRMSKICLLGLGHMFREQMYKSVNSCKLWEYNDPFTLNLPCFNV